MASLSISDASRIAGVSIESMVDKINRGELSQTDKGVEIKELIRVYPNLKPLAAVKLRKVKKAPDTIVPAHRASSAEPMVESWHNSNTKLNTEFKHESTRESANELDGIKHIDLSGDDSASSEHASTSTGNTVELLVRELEWNKDLLEKTNKLMARQLEEQRALIADQARRLDEKDRFWARQIEIAQSLLPAPEPVVAPRKKIFGLF